MLVLASADTTAHSIAPKEANGQEESLFFYSISIIDRVYAIFNKEHFNILC